jgi:hypothetical protein
MLLNNDPARIKGRCRPEFISGPRAGRILKNDIAWIIHKFVAKNTYRSKNIKGTIENSQENNPGYPGFPNKKDLINYPGL